jgi:hypothetical protein
MLGEFDAITNAPVLQMKEIGVCPVKWAVYRHQHYDRYYVEFRCFRSFWPEENRQLINTLVFDEDGCVAVGSSWHDSSRFAGLFLGEPEYLHFENQQAKEAFQDPRHTTRGKIKLYQISLYRNHPKTMHQLALEVLKKARDVD